MTAFTFPRIHPTAKVLRELFAAGFSPISWGEAQIDVDGSIEISSRISVQVSPDGFGVLLKHRDGTYTLYRERRTLKALIADIWHALKQEAK